MDRFNQLWCHRRVATNSRTALLLVMAFASGSATVNAQSEDLIPPTLRTFRFTPTAVDTTHSSRDVAFVVQATDDISGAVISENPCFRSPSGAQFVCGRYTSISRAGDPEVVTGEGVITVPRFSESGTWLATAITLFDRANNQIIHLTADLQALGFQTALEVVSVQDTTPPTLLDFSFTPMTVDVTPGARDVTFVVRATDDLSGAVVGEVPCFRSPSGLQTVCGRYSQISSSGEVATGEGIVTIPEFSESGTWHVLAITVFDRVNNQLTLHAADLRARGFTTALEVVSIQDLTPATLVGLSFTPSTIDTTESSQDVAFVVQATDDVSGATVSEVPCFRSPSGLQTVCGRYIHVSRSGDSEVVTGEGVIQFPAFSDLGSWVLTAVTLFDRANNVVTLAAGALRAAGFPTEILNALSRIHVQVDIKPGSQQNSIDPRSDGVIPVAILTTSSFAAASVNPALTLFGRTGSEAAPSHWALEDVDSDGDTDLMLHFRTDETGILCGDTLASLAGETMSGQPVRGFDSIATVGCR